MLSLNRTITRKILARITSGLAFTVLLFAAHAVSHAAPACFTPWSASAIYTGGQTASLNSVNYTANWWTQGNNPSTNNGGPGSGQPWTSDGACTGSGSGSGSGSGGGSGSTPPPPTGRLFAPYVDMSLTADENIVSIQQQTGFKAITLAFLDTTGSCSVGWGGLGGLLPTDTLPNGTTMLSVVQSLQSAGVQVIISFGGAGGTDPAGNCSSAAQLQAVYQSVLNRYNVKMLDFDIEGGAVSNQAAITQRDQALASLKAANPGLVISYTLPVLPTGLINTGTNILNSVKSDGLALDVVNVMTMDYGSAVDNGGAMGLDATDAASATEAQVQAAGLTATIGITPMIGVNDTTTEVFTISDAQAVLNFANSNSYVSRIAMWSLARDNGSCAGQTTFASPTCSGLSQSNYQFVANFNTF
jgi:hypothetical protein